MNTNDSLVLHLIKHLVRKNDEFSINNNNNSQTILRQENSENFKDYFLQQLDNLQKKFTQLKQEVLEFQPSQSEVKIIQENKPIASTSILESTNGHQNQSVGLAHKILLSPEKELQTALPHALFAHNGDMMSNFGVEVKDKIIFLYFFRIKDIALAKEFSILLHFITNKIILSLQKNEVLDLFKEFDKKILELINKQAQMTAVADIDFAFCVVNKMQAKFDMVSSGIDFIYQEDNNYHLITSDQVKLGSHETHLAKLESIQIKRGNTYFMLPTDLIVKNESQKLVKDFEQNFKSMNVGSFADRHKKLNEWIKTQQKAQFIFSFGF